MDIDDESDPFGENDDSEPSDDLGSRAFEDDCEEPGDDLTDLLSKWARAFDEEGRDIPAEELAKDRPDLVDRLKACIRRLKRMRRFDPGAPPPPAKQYRMNDEPVPGFVLLERLGSGAFGEVWSAFRRPNLEHPTAAVKIVHGNRASHVTIEREGINQMKGLGHSGVLRWFAHTESEGTLFFISELAQESAEQYFLDLRRRQQYSAVRLSAECIRLLRDVADALDAMQHLRDLTHQDIKPSNLLLVNGKCKLGDFGTVRPIQRSAGGAKNSDPGAPFYAAIPGANQAWYLLRPVASPNVVLPPNVVLMTATPPNRPELIAAFRM
jgi:serine/threonine protein kinase